MLQVTAVIVEQLSSLFGIIGNEGGGTLITLLQKVKSCRSQFKHGGATAVSTPGGY